MSVETQATSTTKETEQNTNSNFESCPKESTTGGEERLLTSNEGANEGEPIEADVSHSTKSAPDDVRPVTRAARSWFESLETFERCRVLSFEDGAFLTSMLSIAPWSTGGFGKINWMGAVTTEQLATLSRGNLPTSNGAKVEEKAKAITTDEDLPSDPINESINTDAWRIQQQQADDGHEGNVVGDPGINGSLTSLQSLFDNIFLAFPVAFNHAAKASYSQTSPLVGVNPIYFDEQSWTNTLKSFDNLFISLFENDFLCFDAVDAEWSSSSAWASKLALLQSRMAAVPLALVFLVKLEVSIISSYHDSLTVNTELSNSAGSRLRRHFKELIEYAKNLSEITSEAVADDASALFNSALGLPNGFVAEPVHRLLLPIGLLREKSAEKDWKRLNDGLRLSLDTTLFPKKEGATKDGETNKEAVRQPSEAPATNQKKKKKRARKRKHKKGNQTEKQNPQTVTTVDSGSVSPKGKSTSDAKPAPVAKKTAKQPLVNAKQKGEAAALVATQVDSFDSSTVMSVDTDADEKEVQATDQKTGIVVARVDGVISATNHVGAGTGLGAVDANVEDDVDDTWETVEVRPRGKRKEQQRGVSRNQNNSSDTNSGSKKTKGARTAASRKKTANRKVVREILFNILDRVEDEVKRKKPPVTRPSVNPWKLPNANGQVKDHSVPSKTVSKPEKTMRDVVVGTKQQATQNRKVAPVDKFPKRKNQSDGANTNKDQAQRNKSTQKKGNKTAGVTSADQNTAPTYQETVSAVSTPSNFATSGKDDKNNSEDRTSKTDSKSDGTDEVPSNQGRVVSEVKMGQSMDDPPLPTLLNPQNVNSANSSVASSLEVPNGGHCPRHHSGGPVDGNDVGYHLLDVCDRLSQDMSLFMSRRALALGARRRERGAILCALQDMLSSIWPNRCHVEMYGSCATQLDLPSSDIDVVLVGLDRNMDMMLHPANQVGGSSSGSVASLSNQDLNTLNGGQHQRNHVPHHSIPPYIPIQMQSNADRVRRLAAELEAQPWAVQVNAIPTASVPVIKALCDPSRLIGGSHGGDWMAHHEGLAAQAAAAANQNPDDRELEENDLGEAVFKQPQHAMLPWRGSDVMNGLLKLDITFEGPEHGGIGSTQFSARVVADACEEANVHPDATPLVQVVMVLKELLVQRKLNEPYSGGLSSYALLLLVLALLREREVIRKEIERVEMQRKAMSEGDATVALANTKKSACDEGPTLVVESNTQQPKSPPTKSVESTDTKEIKTSKHGGKGGNNRASSSKQPKHGNSKSQRADHGRTNRSTGNRGSKGFPGTTKNSKSDTSTKSVDSAQSSWASIAKKNSGKKQESKVKEVQPNESKPVKKASFADALSKSSTTEKSRTDGQLGPAAGSHENAERGKQAPGGKASKKENYTARESSKEVSPIQSTLNAEAPAIDPSIIQSSYFAQGFNDIVEVLCSGETTAGKLLMHFLLYYGEHFDAQTTAIDISGKHERTYINQMLPYPYISQYIQRTAHGSIDPITGMLTVDPIVIYDPLEGAENNNVARRCFAWNSVRWIFAQSYATLSSAVERSAAPTVTGKGAADGKSDPVKAKPNTSAVAGSDSNEPMDPSSPLLKCLLSF